MSAADVTADVTANPTNATNAMNSSNGAVDVDGRAVPHWLERIGDRCNPILVKEVRQALKSRQFIITFFLLLTAAWLTAVFGLLMMGDRVQYEGVGRGFFFAFFIALAVATTLVIPFTAFQSLKSERDFNTFELLSVTTLSPGRIVTGKLLSAMVQLFIFYSAITPFIAFSSTMQGFDAAQAAYILAMTLLVSLLLSVFALTVATMTDNRLSQAVLGLALLGGLMSATGLGIRMVSMGLFDFPIPLDQWEFWLHNAVFLVGGASYFVLLRQIAIARLTFEADNHSTGIRATATVQFWLLWLVMFAVFLIDASSAGGWPDEEVFMFLAVLSTIHWAVFGFVMVAEPDSLSRRVRRQITGNALVRFIKAPFLPGGSRGYLLLASQVAAMGLLYLVGMIWFTDSPHSPAVQVGRVLEGTAEGSEAVLAMGCYLLIYCGFCAALARWGHVSGVGLGPAHARLLTFIVLMAAVVGPFLLGVLRLVDYYFGYHWTKMLDPFSTTAELAEQSSQADYVLPLLMILAVGAVAVNLAAVGRGVRMIQRAGRRGGEDGLYARAEEV
jgi:hypothetical protein